MITAVLSARKRTEAGELRAGLTLNGRSVLVWQAETLRKLGAERFVCLHEYPCEETDELREHVESLGCAFHAVQTHAQLIAHLHSDDLLIFMADGLVADERISRSLLSSSQGPVKGILTLPSNHELAQAFPEDFERIDATRNWGGLAVVPAAIAQRLGELPPDGEVLSLLLRIALQARTPMIALPPEEIDEGDWLITRSVAAARSYQRAILERYSEDIPWTAPFDAMASQMVQRLTPSGLPWGATISLAAAATLHVSAGLLAWNGFAGWAITAAAVGVFMFSLASTWRRLQSAIFGTGHGEARSRLFGPAITIATIAVLFLATLDQATLPALLALPVLAIGLSILASKDVSPFLRAFWNDRTLHLAMLAGCAFGGLLSEGLALMALAALSQLMLRASRD
ncbi:hypothetical protein [Erythrobacter ani]|uniref:Uncharacterized protein n=1 Tax=Erythrobacter ani TaxID=2827235 RepID=A0ABS6SQT4_9SPHN|nr:hypothetical protein [Erythrobacter ani]MBV7266994.1 hypothetical protein [Erythrobacter ani]